MDERVHWRIYLELADLRKRDHSMEEAREYYRLAAEAQPKATQIWLEFSKMEEECGHLHTSLEILREGLVKCEFHEALLTRAIRHQEKLNKLDEARLLLGQLQGESLDKVWRAVMEGALLEARAGNTDKARAMFTFLRHNVPWYGPVHYEAFRLEEKRGHLQVSWEVLEHGLKELPRYGPLWFGLLRLSERQDVAREEEQWRSGGNIVLQYTRSAVASAVSQISKELIWKVHFEGALIEERAAMIAAEGSAARLGGSKQAYRHRLFGRCRHCLTRAAITCPSNLRWKVWVVGARLELTAGRYVVAKELLQRAFSEVPSKSRAFVYLECSRLEELCGRVDAARRILLRAKVDVVHEWKVFLELVLLEMRAGRWTSAIAAVREALVTHSGTGRLWAILIHLLHRMGHVDQLTAEFVRALREVPKSGEVWCESARCHMNPAVLSAFDPTSAFKYLSFAIQFTPQYGDSFVEYLRLEIICQLVLPSVLQALGVDVSWFMTTFLNVDPECDLLTLTDRFPGGGDGAGSTGGGQTKLESDDSHKRGSAGDTEAARLDRATLPPVVHPEDIVDIALEAEDFSRVLFESLQRRCVNADPNYGSMWLFSRVRPTDTPAAILRSSFGLLATDVLQVKHVYTRAVVVYVLRCLRTHRDEWWGASASFAPTIGIDGGDGIGTPTTPYVDGAAPQPHEQHAQASQQQRLDEMSRVLRDPMILDTNPAQLRHRRQLARGPALSRRSSSESSSGSTSGGGGSGGGGAAAAGGEVVSAEERARGAEGYEVSDFVAALVPLNRLVSHGQQQSEDVRRRLLFGSDQIVP